MRDPYESARAAVLDISEKLATAVSADYVSTVQQALSVLVPADDTGWVSTDLAHGRVSTAGLPRADELTPVYLGVVDDHPILRSYVQRRRGLAPRRMSDLLSLRRFRSTRTYAELFVPMHAKYQATMMTSIEPTGLAGWTLTRWDTDFSDDDMARLTALQAPLSALERASAVAVAESSERLCEARERAHLSQREVQVLQLAAAGLTAVAIGHRLRISARTVRKHLEHVYDKLGCRDRLMAVQRGQQLGLLPPNGLLRHPSPR